MPMPQKSLYTTEDYYNTPEDVRLELIDGQIYYQASLSRTHQKILGSLHATIYNHIKAKGGSCEVYPAPFAVQLNKNWNTVVEPDISVICDSSKLTDRGCTGAPDWIIEIASPGNANHDYLKKLNLYSAAGVCEYWIVNPMKQTVLVYQLNEEQFEVSAYTFQDSIQSGTFEDLYIDFQSMGL